MRDEERCHQVKLRLMEKWSGTLDGDGTITLDPREAMLPTAIHECLHELMDDHRTNPCAESVIVHMEKEIVKHLSPRQWKNVYRRVGEILS